MGLPTWTKWIVLLVVINATVLLLYSICFFVRESLWRQYQIFFKKHTSVKAVIYTMTFGSFIGYSAGFPLLIKTQFPGVNALSYAFLGPLVGALIRPFGGWLSDKLGGARVTFWNFIVMIAAVFGVLYFLPKNGTGGDFVGFLIMFLILFATTGVGNGSTFRMIPIIFRAQHERWSEGADDAAREQAMRNASTESAAVLGFTSAVAAFGAFFIPKAYGTSIAATGGPETALYVFITYYVTSLAVTWWWYSRRNAEIPC